MAKTDYVFGDRELVAALKQLPDKMQDSVVNSATRAGAKVVQNDVKANAPRRSGKYADNIVVVKVTKKLQRRGFVGQYVVGVRRPFSNLTHLLEFGFYNKRAGRFIPGQAFWRGALANKQAVFQAMQQAAAKSFRRNAKKLAGSAGKSGQIRRKGVVRKVVGRG